MARGPKNPKSSPESDGPVAESALFSVDTHLFRELGELLVGRDSTALVELVKNSYDADATEVTVYAERLLEAEGGFIVVTDDGNGMTPEEFRRGFLTIASRSKESGDRRSPVLGRRYTGEKGVGRLAAHKLARQITVRSIPRRPSSSPWRGLQAVIDWEALETFQTLDEAGAAVVLESFPVESGARSGTEIRLSSLRRPWSIEERDTFLSEAGSFEPPDALKQPLRSELASGRLLFAEPVVRDEKGTGAAEFRVAFEGDFEGQGDLWDELLETVEWIAEISSRPDGIRYVVAPTAREKKAHPTAHRETYALPQPDPKNGPFYDGRVMFRARGSGTSLLRNFSRQVSGIRVYMEGFRVLPYGEVGNDWLWLDRDVTQRLRSLRSLERRPELERASEGDSEWALTIFPNDSYVGAVFLTNEGAPTIHTLVNREGFVPNAAYADLQAQVRIGIDLIVRARSAANAAEREERRRKRRAGADTSEKREDVSPAVQRREALRESVEQAQTLSQATKAALSGGDAPAAEQLMTRLEAELGSLSQQLADFVTEQGYLPVLASVGIQMAQFTHEINGLVALAQTVDVALARIREGSGAKPRGLPEAHRTVVDLRRRLERQASYLVDVISPDSRRRRVRQELSQRFDAAARLVSGPAYEKRLRLDNQIPPELKSPPMFPAELTAVLGNLLTNAVKASKKDSRILAVAFKDDDGRIHLRIENTGIHVDLSSAERWFRPFESTTATVDPVLGQGMGLGLPISRAILEEYGAEIQFVRPSERFATAIEITFKAD